MVLQPDGVLPTGPEHICLDAMVLIGWNNAGHLDRLGKLLGRAYTADVITKREIPSGIGRFPQNRDILDVDWLVEAPVRDEDAELVANIHGIWGSDDHKDMGEAEIIALCNRHRWTAITDDKQGRGTLESYGARYAYRASLLICAAACGEQDLDAASAWAIHREVEQGTHVADERKYHRCIALAKRVRERYNPTSWIELVGNPYIDHIIDVADQRTPKRRLPSS